MIKIFRNTYPKNHIYINYSLKCSCFIYFDQAIFIFSILIFSAQEEISSPLGAQMFDFCESELFPETFHSSEVVSSSNNCYYNEDLSFTSIKTTTTEDHTNDPSPPLATATSPPPPPIAATGNNHISIIFDEDDLENDISASIDFTASPSFPTPHDHYFSNNNNNNNNSKPLFDHFSLTNHLPLGDIAIGAHHHYAHESWPMLTAAPPPQAVVPLMAPSAYNEDDCLPSIMPSTNYLRLRSSQPASCSLMVDPMMAAAYLPPGPFENSGFFTGGGGGGLMMGGDISHQDLDFQGDGGGIFLNDTMARAFNCSNDLQLIVNIMKGISGENQHMVHGGVSNTSLSSEISSLEDPTFKVGKLSAEERKKKIHRYMKKRNERNFSKKIKYACRKTLADSRPRVRGRFAKNDELGELSRTHNHDDDVDDDVGVKEEDDMESADILAHISGVNSFKCNYPIQSWI
ncbi:PREDICTED: uncharacterized protein LOC105950524 [Erythranthe guttata]|uniref:uncharacterized protein LOC105950524 n=1 Tax=Erythranthe guttata TaxID=4155 RepID=UPI00064DB100|nr:PREDICTED: uncharacterized protein LOC105950524 [Erythranthe guttata]|eukprot:XP_012829346.1 PREDICTED: uncharacterized protein LOC105950524 [Erythranthe guttata]